MIGTVLRGRRNRIAPQRVMSQVHDPVPTLAVLLPDARTEEVIARLGRLVARLAQHGVEVDGPSMTLSYLAVRVIPG